ncbi:hypothetical protein J6590_048892 [Homalodisca vitripennis]|nr:hypothetical protein J6590_048892 [Homalodisca vitripennis]
MCTDGVQETVEEEGQGELDMEVAEVQETDGREEEVAADTEAVEASLTVSMPNIEALIVNRANLGLANTVLTAEEPFVVSRVEETTLPVSQTLHADATGTITLPALSGQDALTQESIREIEESLNQQLFCTADLSLDKEQVVLFDQGFESCVFPSITQIELGQALTSASLASILPTTTPTVFSCEECGAQYKSDSELNAHRLSHLQKQCLVESRTITLGDTTIQLEEDLAAANLPSIDTDHDVEYRCDVCNHLCESGEDLAKHRESHSSCEICEKTFATVAQYKAHVKSHGREKEYVCEHCGSSFTQLYSLARHVVIHNSEEKIFNCSVCNQSFRTEGLLRRHANEHREGKIAARRRRGEVRQLTEEEAQRLATQEGNSMSERVLIASIAERDRISDVKDPEMFKNEPVHANCCKYCPKSFRKPSDLVRHLRIHTGERPYQCDFCAKCFTVKSTLDSHLKTHNSQKRCVCHVCGFFFATKGSLKVHMRLHTGSRPFRCPVCLQRFRTSGHRKSHLLLHIKEAQPQLLREVAGTSTTQPDPTATTVAAPLANLGVVAQYSCNVCEKTFNKQSTLVRHTRVHTGEKPFQCKVCDKCFTQKNSLDTHMKIHTGERQFSCTECEGTSRPQRFTQKCNLDTHIRRHHPPTPTPTPFTIDLSEEKFPVDLEKVVSDLFPHMKSKAALAPDEL